MEQQHLLPLRVHGDGYGLRPVTYTGDDGQPITREQIDAALAAGRVVIYNPPPKAAA